MSCVKRSLSVLLTTYQSVVTYMERDTMVIRYEMVWFDNGSPQEEIDRLLEMGPQFESTKHSPENLGYAYATNQVYFGTLCTAPYILNLEDDWRPHPAPPLRHAHAMTGRSSGGPGRWLVDHVRVAIDILKQHGQVSGVRLKNEFTDLAPYKLSDDTYQVQTYPASRAAEAGAPLAFEYKLQCLDIAGTSAIWGGWTTAAAVYDRARLKAAAGGELFGVPGDGFPGGGFFLSEANFATRVGLAGLCTAHVHFQEACGGWEKRRADAGAPFLCHDVFKHTGTLSDVQPNEGRQKENDMIWFFYGTPLWDKVRKSQMS